MQPRDASAQNHYTFAHELNVYPRILLKHQEISFELGVASLSKNLKEDEKRGTQTQESGPKKVLTGRKFLKVMCSTYTMADNWSLRQEEEEERSSDSSGMHSLSFKWFLPENISRHRAQSIDSMYIYAQKNTSHSLAWWHMRLVPALGRQRQWICVSLRPA